MPARPLRRFEPALLAVGFALAAHAGCSNPAASSSGVTHPTLIEIAPEQFTGEVPCAAGGDQPGLKRYVATLIDPNESNGAGGASSDDGAAAGAANANDFALPSSAPTSCLAGVGFGFIVPGRHYFARIQGYDRDDVAARAPGSPLMVDGDGKAAAPRWTAECDATLAVEETIVRVKRCTNFTPADATGPGSVRVRLEPLLGSLRCGDEAGQVDHLTVSLDVGGAPLVRTVDCTAGEAVFEGLPPYQQAVAFVEAFSAGSASPLAGGSCAARTLPEASVVAQCAALNEEGTLRVDLPAALELLGLRCEDVSDVRVEALGVDEPTSYPPPSCRQTVDQGFAAGAASVTVTAIHDGEASAVSCFGEVSPGRVVVADCELP
jgi:hypothetical protein